MGQFNGGGGVYVSAPMETKDGVREGMAGSRQQGLLESLTVLYCGTEMRKSSNYRERKWYGQVEQTEVGREELGAVLAQR